jgi:hypothetical protein
LIEGVANQHFQSIHKKGAKRLFYGLIEV